MTEIAPMSANNHPGPEEIAAYLSNALSPDERALIDAHLSRCRSCRRQVTSANALLRTRPRPMRWLAIATAAAIAIMLTRPWTFRDGARTQSEVERARTGAQAADLAIIALEPADGDTIRGVSPRFTWRSRGPDVLYHLSLSEASGRALWTVDTRDTTIVLAPNVQLAVGTRYFWLVDALSANAVSWTTGTRTFLVAP